MSKKQKKPSRQPDAFDCAILRILQNDNKTSQRTIADSVNLSPAAVQRRIASMEEDGIIMANVAAINPAAFDLTITSYVEVKLRDERSATVDAAKKIFLNTPEVQQCYYVTGGISFVLVIVTVDMTHYEALTRQLFSESDIVESFRSLIALDRVKTGVSIPIPEHK